MSLFNRVFRPISVKRYTSLIKKTNQPIHLFYKSINSKIFKTSRQQLMYKIINYINFILKIELLNK